LEKELCVPFPARPESGDPAAKEGKKEGEGKKGVLLATKRDGGSGEKKNSLRCPFLNLSEKKKGGGRGGAVQVEVFLNWEIKCDDPRKKIASI